MKNNLAALQTAAGSVLNSRRAAVVKYSAPQVEIVQLLRDKTIRLEKRSDIQSAEAKSGMIWLMGTPAHGDVILSADDRFEFQDDWPFVIQALEPAELSLLRHL
jgi:hypothetical protein